jgi:hypothetical protein
VNPILYDWPDTQQIIEGLESPFQKELFQTAIKDFDSSTSPLRLNYLCTTLRELSRLILHGLAPESQIKTCSWYEPLIQNGQEIITRSQRVHYAVHAGLPINFVRDELHVDVEKTAKQFSALVNSFNKYTHLDENTFATDASDAELFAEKAIEMFGSLLETIEECRLSTQSAFETYAQEAVEDVLYSNMHDEIDQLSTHSSVSQVNVEEVTIDTLDSQKVKISVSGSVDCHLQYGSDSDNDNGDGAKSIANLPFDCKYEADAASPQDLTLVHGSMVIDNSSFYEDQGGDLE